MKNKEKWSHARYIKTEKGKYIPNFEMVNPRSVYVYQRAVNTYAEAMQAHCTGVLLDCGCGFVPYYGIYKNLVDDNICIDWENTLHKNEFLDKVVNLNEGIPYPSNSFDTILLTDVLEHISEPRKLMGEISRVLKPEGKLILGVPFIYWVHEAPHDFYRYTEFALKMFCEENGLSVISIKPFGGYVDLVLDLANKYLGRNKKLGKVFLKVATWIGNSSLAKKNREKTDRVFPTGYCMVAQKQ